MNPPTSPATPPTPPPFVPMVEEAPPMPSAEVPAMITSAPPKKHMSSGKIFAAVLGLFLLIGGVGAGVYLTGQNQDVRNRAESLASSTPTDTPSPAPTATPAPTLAPETTVVGVSSGANEITVTIPKIAAQCDWGHFGNLSKKSSCFQARKYSLGTFSVPSGCSVQSANITTGAGFGYDDYLVLTLDNTVIATHQSLNLSGKAWDWDTVKGMCPGKDSAKTSNFVCFKAQTCKAPKSSTTGAVNIAMNSSDLSAVLQTGNDHSFQVILGGDDNDTTDCHTVGAVNLKVTYSCTNAANACSGNVIYRKQNGDYAAISANQISMGDIIRFAVKTDTFNAAAKVQIRISIDGAVDKDWTDAHTDAENGAAEYYIPDYAVTKTGNFKVEGRVTN